MIWFKTKLHNYSLLPTRHYNNWFSCDFLTWRDSFLSLPQAPTRVLPRHQLASKVTMRLIWFCGLTGGADDSSGPTLRETLNLSSSVRNALWSPCFVTPTGWNTIVMEISVVFCLCVCVCVCVCNTLHWGGTDYRVSQEQHSAGLILPPALLSSLIPPPIAPLLSPLLHHPTSILANPSSVLMPSKTVNRGHESGLGRKSPGWTQSSLPWSRGGHAFRSGLCPGSI